MEDLDSLLEDLGRGKSSSTSIKKQRPPSSRVDLNELEDLMEDLAAPTSKQMPAPTPVVIPATSAPVVMSTPKADPTPPAPAPTPTPQTATVDDLDALMESLNAASRSSSRRPPSTRVAPKQSTTFDSPPVVTPPPPAPAPTPAPAQPAPVHTPPPAQPAPTYNPPAQTYTPPAQSRPTTQSYSAPTQTSTPSSDLDNLLNNLSKQMNNIDVSNPASRGTCGTCGMAILGEVIQALGKTYHPEHFTCGNCHMPLGTATFYEQAGKPHCERCFQEAFCPRCAHCEKPIMDRCITALGKKWHVEHFICTQCLQPFPGGNFFERDGRPYCEADFYGLYAPKCGSCHEAIRGDCINALGQQWHPEHFVCTYCQKSFAGGCFFEHGGKPYCEIHYHQQSGSLCAGCGKPIAGRCVNALDKKWHPEHFVCAFCMNPLAGGSFTEHNSKAYCKECHGKLFSQ